MPAVAELRNTAQHPGRPAAVGTHCTDSSYPAARASRMHGPRERRRRRHVRWYGPNFVITEPTAFPSGLLIMASTLPSTRLPPYYARLHRAAVVSSWYKYGK
ncbi:hypothetical protein FA95DRAFT_1297638 [Auriscalpium vulgare]|uniref:Uncharacterized protein n=1 Tax=Auriscalpium vulgare TaxID=40419 RepID=A0ACB8R266_9AGAM|nr:hypothetical protein FA95DRAFT_1297638 [Auriscalpium vulgare]